MTNSSVEASWATAPSFYVAPSPPQMTPKPYQLAGVEYALARDHCLLGDEMGLGKLQPISSPILTPSGWKKIGDVRVGDLVFSVDGNPTEVTGVFPQGSKSVYRVWFRDGCWADAGAEHLWAVRNQNHRNRGGAWRVRTTQQIIDLYDSTERHGSRYEIPVAEAIIFPERNLPVDPYVLGVLLGDGCTVGRNLCFSNPDFDSSIHEEVSSRLPPGLALRPWRDEKGSCPRYHFKGDIKPLRTALQDLGVRVKSGQKFVPEEYKTASVAQRMDLLRGLMDTDGSCARNRTTFHTTSAQLASDVADLVRSLGGVAKERWYNRAAENKPAECQVSVRLAECPFLTPRKATRWRAPSGNKRICRYITHVENLNRSEESVCIRVAHPSHLYVTKDYIVTHNTAQAILVGNAIEAKRTLVVCPASLRLNWEREIWMWSTIENVLTYPVLKAKDGVSTQAHYVIVSYDLLRNPGILGAIMDLRWDHLILDECFPAGTQVDTEHGPMDIAEIVNKKLAVRVWSWRQGVLELKPVRRYVKSNSHSLLEVHTRLGYSIVCTPNHKIWTDNRGYVEAGNLREGDEVRVRSRQNSGVEESEPRKGSGAERQKQIAVQDSCECSCAAESSRESGRGQAHRQGGGLRVVRVECRKDEPVLREKMFRHLEVESLPRGRERKSGGYAFCAAGHGRSGQEISFRENEASQFRPGVSRQSGRNIEVAERPVVVGGTRGKRIPHEAAASTTFLSGLALGEFGVRDKHCGCGGGMPAQPLQSRLGAPRIEDRCRSGWIQPQNKEMEVSGREKNGGTVVDRVERVKTYERGNISRRRGVSEKSTPTYNLEVEDNHNYFANGILVSNCHALKDVKGNQRTKVICAPDLIPSVVGRITMASGTIMSNTPSDAYNSIRLLNWDAIDRASLQDFRENYYALGGGMVRSPVYDPKKGAMVSKLHWSEEVRNVPTNLADLQFRMRKNIMVRRLKQDVLKDLPTAQWRPFPLVMTAGIKTALAHPGWKMAEKLYDMDALDTGVPIDGQIATARRLLGEAKAPAVAEYIEEMLREGATKLLVCAWHSSVLEILKKRLQKHGLVYMDGATSAGARQQAVDSFQQNPDIRIILGQMQVIGTGWTLTVAQDCVLAEPDWVPGNNDQMLARIHRIGQAGAYVTGHVPVVPGTLDERILGTAVGKSRNIFVALDKRD